MDLNQPTAQPVQPAYSRPPGIFGGKIPSAVSFTLAILLFLLPFAEIRCGNTPLTEKSGFDMALANNWKPASGYGKEFLGKMTAKNTSAKEGNSQWFAIGALGLAVLALVCCLGAPKLAGSGGTFFGVLSAGALVALIIELKRWFSNTLAKEAAEKAKSGTDTSLNDVEPTLGFTPWIYVAIIVLLVGAYFGYRRMKENRT